jgi:hypothetical protein
VSAIVGSSMAARIAGFARSKVLEKRINTPGRYPRPLVDFYDSRKKKTQFVGNEVLVGIKEPASNLSSQKWAGSDTLNNAVELNPGMMASFTSSNMFSSIKWGFDDLRKSCGVTILPNDNGAQQVDGRVYRRDSSSERVLYDKLTEDIESMTDRFSELRDLEVHRQGATAKDLAGLNAILPIQNAGNYGGLDRGKIPVVQHVVFAGNDGNGTNPPWIGARGVVGSTLLVQLEEFFTQLRAAASTCGLPKGKWRCFVGRGFLKMLKAELRSNKMQFNVDAEKGDSKINLLITDERLGLSSPDLSMEWDPTLETLDVIAAAEVGIGPSQIALTFNGGGATRQAKGLIYVTAAGALDKVVITDQGEGYTTAPTVALGNVGAGVGGAVTVTVFKETAGAGLTQVDADDVRIGRIATVAVTAGAGYPTTGTAAPFTNRLYALYEPSWQYLVQDGLDQYLSIPSDNPRARMLEQQLDHTHALVCNCPRVNGVFAASAT